MILVYFLFLAVAVGYLRGGRLKNYLDRPLRLVYLPIAAFAAEALMAKIGRRALEICVLIEYALLFAFCFFNRGRRGVLPIACAAALNLAAILANGFRMPVSPAVYDFAALQPFVQRVASGELFEYALVGYDAPLWWLGDCLPVPVLVPGLASPGDVLLGAGLFWLVQDFMRAGRRKIGPSAGAQG